MAKRLLLLVLFVPLIPVVVALAHENRHHIMGNVASVHASELVVETQDGKTVTILLTEDTVYRAIAKEERMGVMAKDADLKPGSRVVVDIAGEGHEITATQVRFSAVPMEADGRGESSTVPRCHDRNPSTRYCLCAGRLPRSPEPIMEEASASCRSPALTAN